MESTERSGIKLDDGDGSSLLQASASPSSSSSSEEHKSPGEIEPSKCTATGVGISGGGTAGTPVSFVVTARDADGLKVPCGGATMEVKISSSSGSSDQAAVKDNGDGTYAMSYSVNKRGNYMVSVEVNGMAISGSPFPVFFAGNAGVSTTTNSAVAAVAVSKPTNVESLPRNAGEGVLLPGLGASLGLVCKEFLSGTCGRPDCKFNHPSQNQLIAALSSGNRTASSSATAMVTAQNLAIVQAYQAMSYQLTPPSQENGQYALKVSNLQPDLSEQQIHRLFSFCGRITKYEVAENKEEALVEFARPEQAQAALSLDNMEVGGRRMKVQLASPEGAPALMQHAAAMQQLQYQQALLLQQAMASQQAALRAATLRNATQTSAARAAEISKRLNGEGEKNENHDRRRRSSSSSSEDSRDKRGRRRRSRSRSKGRRSRSRSKGRRSSSRSGGRRSRSRSEGRRRTRSASPKHRQSSNSSRRRDERYHGPCSSRRRSRSRRR